MGFPVVLTNENGHQWVGEGPREQLGFLGTLIMLTGDNQLF